MDKLGKELAEKIKLDWNNPRVVCIAESYSKFDIDTVEVVPLRIELLKYRYYDEGIFSLEPYYHQSAIGYLPQGAATSPLLSNLVMRDCDIKLHAIAMI